MVEITQIWEKLSLLREDLLMPPIRGVAIGRYYD